MISLKHRIDAPELMDTTDLPAPALQQTLRFLEFANTHFGGTQIILKYLQRWSRHWPYSKTIRILDVGTGNADIPRAIVRWARYHGLHVHVTAIDLIQDIVQIARERSLGFGKDIDIRQANFFELLPKKERFDYVVASLLLHHVAPDETVRVLKEFDQLALRGIIISDLLRSQKSYWAVTVASYLFGNAIVRHDGPLSVRRAFQLQELESMAHKAGLPYLKARQEAWFRVSLAGEKLHAYG